MLNLFSIYGDVYRLKNLIARRDIERFLRKRVEDGATARIAMHFYPQGRGYLGCHTDPFGAHQEITATLIVDSVVAHKAII